MTPNKASPINAQEILDNFLRRDTQAVEELKQPGIFPGSVEHIMFINGRLVDVAAICIFLLKREIERESNGPEQTS